MTTKLKLKDAAEKMGICPAYARKYLLSIDRQHPGLGVIERKTGNPRGNMTVDLEALAIATNQSARGSIEDLFNRVGILEADVETLRARLHAVERGEIRVKCQCSEKS